MKNPTISSRIEPATFRLVAQFLNLLRYRKVTSLYHYLQQVISCSWIMEILCYHSNTDWLRAGRLRDRGSSPGRVKNFHFSISSRPALGSTQPPIQWVPGALSRGYSGRGVKLTAHLQLVPRSRICGSIYPLPHVPSWHNASLYSFILFRLSRRTSEPAHILYIISLLISMVLL
jgi:hypothetical protein